MAAVCHLGLLEILILKGQYMRMRCHVKFRLYWSAISLSCSLFYTLRCFFLNCICLLIYVYIVLCHTVMNKDFQIVAAMWRFMQRSAVTGSLCVHKVMSRTSSWGHLFLSAFLASSVFYPHNTPLRDEIHHSSSILGFNYAWPKRRLKWMPWRGLIWAIISVVRLPTSPLWYTV